MVIVNLPVMSSLIRMKETETKGLVAEVTRKFVHRDGETISYGNSYYELKFEEEYSEIIMKKYLGQIQEKHDAYLQGQRELQQMYSRKMGGGREIKLNCSHGQLLEV